LNAGNPSPNPPFVGLSTERTFEPIDIIIYERTPLKRKQRKKMKDKKTKKVEM